MRKRSRAQETAGALVQAEVADLSSSNHVLGHSPSLMCIRHLEYSPEFLDPHGKSQFRGQVVLSEKKIGGNGKRISIGKSSAVEVGP